MSELYVPGGEILIEKRAEERFSYLLSNYELSEVKGHIRRQTYVSRNEMDPDLNIINVKNGLNDWRKDELKPHDPSYYSINQNPIIYDPKAKPELFGNFLMQVLYPTNIRTAIDAMAYTNYRDCPFKHYFRLFGDGANGKSVFTGLLTGIHGERNVSNLPLLSLIEDGFALSDLEFRNINIDTEMSGVLIK